MHTHALANTWMCFHFVRSYRLISCRGGQFLFLLAWRFWSWMSTPNPADGPCTEGHSHNGCHVALGSIDVHVESKLLPDLPHHSEALLVVGTSATDKDTHVVLQELVLVLRQCTYYALCMETVSSIICKVHNM